MMVSFSEHHSWPCLTMISFSQNRSWLCTNMVWFTTRLLLAMVYQGPVCFTAMTNHGQTCFPAMVIHGKTCTGKPYWPPVMTMTIVKLISFNVNGSPWLFTINNHGWPWSIHGLDTKVIISESSLSSLDIKHIRLTQRLPLLKTPTHSMPG